MQENVTRPAKPLFARAVDWLDQRYRVRSVWKSIAEHEVPAHVNWMYCLGGITFFLFGVQAITGIIMAFYYKPNPDQAYQSVQFIVYQLPLGWLVRTAHRWAADGMVLMVILHMLRVFFTGSYKRPRQLNWVVGVFLFVITFTFAITGFLLPWDQQAYWGTSQLLGVVQSTPVVGPILAAVLRGGAAVGAATLRRFFALHVMALPVVILVFLAVHFVVIRRQGISGPL
ncbi:MAG TPA: cytochrome b N-terminal domain-containing protein [Bacillota bacterium]|jgi:quinol-cytochrome oxidoreductase complex cytochrome b subunit